MRKVSCVRYLDRKRKISIENRVAPCQACFSPMLGGLERAQHKVREDVWVNECDGVEHDAAYTTS